MPRTAAQGEVLMKAQLLQLVTETVPGTYDPTGNRVVLTCLQGDFQPDAAWDSFRPDGFNVDAWHAMSREWRVYTGQVRWDYHQGWTLEELLAGAGTLTDPAPASAEEATWSLASHDARQLTTFTLEYGQPISCERCTYGILVSINQNLDRDAANVDGQLTILCRKPEASGVQMTGTAAQNSIWKLSAGDDDPNPLTVSVMVADGLAQEVTINRYDSGAEIAAKFALLNGIDSVDVTDSVTEVAKVFRFHPVNPSGNYTFNSSATFAPGDSTSAIQTKIRGTGGSFANATVAGTSTASASGPLIHEYENNTASNDSPISYDAGSGNSVVVKKWSAYYSNMGNAPADILLQGSNNNTDWTTIDTEADPQGGVFPDDPYEVLSNNTSYRYHRIIGSAANGYRLDGFRIYGADTVATLDITVTVPTSATNPNPSTPAVTGTNSSGALTVQTPYSGVGDITIEFDDPGNVLVMLATEDEDDWTLTLEQTGSDGKITVPPRVPILPNQFGVRIASTRGGLAAAPLVPAVKKATWALESVVETVFFAQEGELSFQSHADDPDGRQLTLTLLLGAKSSLVETLNGYSAAQPATPFWLELRCVKDAHNVTRRQFYVAPSAVRKRTAAGKIMAWEYTLKPVLSDQPFEADGASYYSILKRAAA